MCFYEGGASDLDLNQKVNKTKTLWGDDSRITFWAITLEVIVWLLPGWRCLKERSRKCFYDLHFEDSLRNACGNCNYYIIFLFWHEVFFAWFNQLMKTNKCGCSKRITHVTPPFQLLGRRVSAAAFRRRVWMTVNIVNSRHGRVMINCPRRACKSDALPFPFSSLLAKKQFVWLPNVTLARC